MFYFSGLSVLKSCRAVKMSAGKGNFPLYSKLISDRKWKEGKNKFNFCTTSWKLIIYLIFDSCCYLAYDKRTCIPALLGFNDFNERITVPEDKKLDLCVIDDTGKKSILTVLLIKRSKYGIKVPAFEALGREICSLGGTPIQKSLSERLNCSSCFLLLEKSYRAVKIRAGKVRVNIWLKACFL